MAKLIRINRKLARRGGKLVLDTNGAPCCCGEGCPACDDPTRPREGSCDPLPTPVGWWLGQGFPSTTSVVWTLTRTGRVSCSFDWIYNDRGDREFGDVAGTFGYAFSEQLPPDSRDPCRLRGWPDQGQFVDFTLFRSNGQQFQTYVSAGTLFAYSPVQTQRWNGIDIWVMAWPYRVAFQSQAQSLLGMASTGWGGLNHGARLPLTQQQAGFMGVNGFNRVDWQDCDTYEHTVEVGGRYTGNVPCAVNCCVNIKVAHSNSAGFVDFEYQEQFAMNATCLYPTDGSSGELVIPGGICTTRPPPQQGDLGGGVGAGTLDPNVQRILDLQARGGGCLSCGDGFQG